MRSVSDNFVNVFYTTYYVYMSCKMRRQSRQDIRTYCRSSQLQMLTSWGSMSNAGY